RADIPEEDRRPFFLYVDEFPTFAAPATIASFLSEARKYRTAMALAHQHLAQIPEELRGSIFGNVGTLASFQVSGEDAEYLARELAPTITVEQLTNLAQPHFALRLIGAVSDTFTAKTLPPPPLPATASREREHLLRRSRRHFARPRGLIDRTTAHRFE